MVMEPAQRAESRAERKDVVCRARRIFLREEDGERREEEEEDEKEEEALLEGGEAALSIEGLGDGEPRSGEDSSPGGAGRGGREAIVIIGAWLSVQIRIWMLLWE